MGRGGMESWTTTKYGWPHRSEWQITALLCHCTWRCSIHSVQTHANMEPITSTSITDHVYVVFMMYTCNGHCGFWTLILSHDINFWYYAGITFITSPFIYAHKFNINFLSQTHISQCIFTSNNHLGVTLDLLHPIRWCARPRLWR